MYIVAFNGPPRSGKDTLAEMLANHMDRAGVGMLVVPESLSLPLREISYAMTGWTGPTDGHNYEEFKNAFFFFFGVAGRRVMIDVSEKFLKPTYVLEVMANLLIARNEGIGPAVLLIRDSGFQIEVDPLIRWVGEENLVIVNVKRDGTSFDGDSREWVNHPRVDRQLEGFNNGTLTDLEAKVPELLSYLTGFCGWKL